MRDSLGFLCGFLFALLIVVVAGHGIWLFLAAVWRAFMGTESYSPQPLGRPCPVCGSPRGVAGDRCRTCGAPATLTENQSQRVELNATRRRLNAWLAQGQIRPEEHQALLKLLQSDEQQILQASPHATAPSETASPLSPLESELFPHVSERMKSPSAASSLAAAQPVVQPPPVHQPPTPAAPAALAASATTDEPICIAEVVESSVERPQSALATASPFRGEPPRQPELVVPPTPRRTLADMLQAFMEETNIRWVEIICGLLIVGCSVGFVISLRETLKDNVPYFPALSFMLVTAAIHGAGIYSLRRWNLKTTSRGVLIIGTLLVPLTFLASIVLSGPDEKQLPVTHPVFLIAVAIGLASFGTMNYFASRALVRHGWWRLMTAVLGTSVSQVLINRLQSSESTPLSAASLLSLPVGMFLIANFALLWMAVKRRRLGIRPAQQFYLELGIYVFALLAPIGLFLAKSNSIDIALGNLSPVLSLAAAAIMASGLLAERVMVGPKLAGYRTASTALAIFGAGLMLLMVAFAWPQLELLVAVGLVDFALLTAFAIFAELSLLHVLAVGCFGLAYLSAFHLWQGNVAGEGSALSLKLVQATFTGKSGLALTLFTTAIAAAGGLMLRKRLLDAGRHYFVAAGGLSALCIAIAIYAGFFTEPSAQADLATPLLVYFAVVALVAGWIINRFEATVLGSVLLLVGLVHALFVNVWLESRLEQFGWQLERPVLISFLAHSLLASLVAAGSIWSRRWLRRDAMSAESDGDAARKLNNFALPLGWSAVASSVAATPFALAVSEERFGSHAAYVLCASVAWLCLALVTRPGLSFSVFQVLATISLVYTTTAVCVRQAWWNHNLLAATHLYCQAAVLAVWCGAWSTFRGLSRSWPVIGTVARRASEGLPTRLWPATATFDQLLLGALTGAVLFGALLGCLPGIFIELGVSSVDADQLGPFSPHHQWYQRSAWLAVALVAVVLIVSLWERRSLITLTAIVIVSCAVPLLIAGPFDNQNAVASALRWLFGVLVVAWCVPACYWAKAKTAIEWLDGKPPLDRPADVMRIFSLVLGMLAVITLTTAAVWSVGAGNRPGGPAAASLFARMGSSLSYAGPLSLLVGVLFAYAVREAKSGYAFASSLVFQYALSLACLLPVLSSGAAFDQLVWAKLLQWNAVGLGLFTCAWVAARRWIEPERAMRVWPPANVDVLQVQVALLFVAQLSIAIWIAGMLFVDPVGIWPATGVLGSGATYFGLVIGMLGAFWLLRRGPWEMLTHAALVLLFVAIHVVGATVHALDGSGQWWGHHAMSAGRIGLAAAAVTGAVWLTIGWRGRWKNEAEGAVRANVIWATIAIVFAVLAALRGALSDPWRPWWPMGLNLAGMVLAGVLAVRGRRLGFACFSTALAGLAATLLWVGLAPTAPLRHGVGFVAVHVIALSLSAYVWLVMEVFFQRRGEPGLDPRLRFPAGHRLVGILAIAAIIAYFLGAVLVVTLAEDPLPMRDAEFTAAVLALVSLFALFLGSMWDRRSVHALPGLYVLCLAAIAFAVERLQLPQTTRIVVLMAAVATQVAVSGWLWSWGAKLALVGQRLGIPEPIEGLRRTTGWLPAVTQFLTAILILASFVVVLNSDMRQLRVVAGCIPFLLATGLAGLAQQHRRETMQLLTLLVTACGAVLLGWADIQPDWSERVLLLRAIRLLMALSAVTFFFGVIAVRVLKEATGWRNSVRQTAIMLGGSAIVALLSVLALEVATFEPGVGAPVDAIQIVAVSVVLVALLAALLSLAVLPGRDPFALSERGRMMYVYAAQVVAGLLFAHVYLAKPMLFHGLLRPYWPYIVVAIAFAGVGVGEAFQRLGWRVLAEPFQRSGAFMPLVPALGMWVVNSESSYSLVLFVIGVLYMLVSFSQKSPLAGAAAAVSCNGALWSLMNGTEDLTFSQHPQFWLIPPAVSVLVAVQINRHRLSETQLSAARYVSVAVIYLSSSVEMLKIGIGESLWPPVILISLAIAGVFFGIAMQIRAYLYLGSVFILVALVSMVAHAARSIHHVWPWWAFGIAVGMLILVLFGWFEGRRTQILALVARLREWEK